MRNESFLIGQFPKQRNVKTQGRPTRAPDQKQERKHVTQIEKVRKRQGGRSKERRCVRMHCIYRKDRKDQQKRRKANENTYRHRQVNIFRLENHSQESEAGIIRYRAERGRVVQKGENTTIWSKTVHISQSQDTATSPAKSGYLCLRDTARDPTQRKGHSPKHSKSRITKGK